MTKRFAAGFLSFLTVLAILGCKEKTPDHQTAYTKIDSLTELYLNLQDSMLYTWNMMITDDNQKLKAMENLIHELEVAGEFDPEQLKALSFRLEQLQRIRYTQKTMINTDIVEEYDFASNSLITELIALTESYPAYAYNPLLQELVERIRVADQRVASHRDAYDVITVAYNRFIEANQIYLKEIDQSATLEKKPLFQMVSE
jgi:hypothetical protein